LDCSFRSISLTPDLERRYAAIVLLIGKDAKQIRRSAGPKWFEAQVDPMRRTAGLLDGGLSEL
jgi:hypothetical protein